MALCGRLSHKRPAEPVHREVIIPVAGAGAVWCTPLARDPVSADEFDGDDDLDEDSNVLDTMLPVVAILGIVIVVTVGAFR